MHPRAYWGRCFILEAKNSLGGGQSRGTNDDKLCHWQRYTADVVQGNNASDQLWYYVLQREEEVLSVFRFVYK